MNDRAASVIGWVRAANKSPQVVGVVRRVRSALPGDSTIGDPLSMAGPGTALAVARVADRLLDDEPGASREISLGALQLWQALLERTGHGRGDRAVTILFTDLVRFSPWSLAAGDEDTLLLLRQVSRAIEPPIVERGGRVVKRLGDGVMATFARPENAVAAVMAARQNLAKIDVHGYTPHMRVGIHQGQPRQVGDDWLGVDVTVAARVMQTGGDGNIMISESTSDALPPTTLTDLGLRAKPYRRAFFAPKLSGMPDDVKILRLVED